LSIYEEYSTYETTESIFKWLANFNETGTVLKHICMVRQRMWAENCHIWEAYEDSSSKYVHITARQFQLSRWRVHKILHQCLYLYMYKLQCTHDLRDDLLKGKVFVEYMMVKHVTILSSY